MVSGLGSTVQSASENMASAQLHPEVFDEYLRKELDMGRMLGPFPSALVSLELHINRFGEIPKGQSRNCHLITDLSFQQAGSVKDVIDTELCSVSYTTVDHVAEVSVSLGPGTLLAKVDIGFAYRLMATPCLCRPYAPFRSSPKIFHAVANVLHWRLQLACT